MSSATELDAGDQGQKLPFGLSIPDGISETEFFVLSSLAIVLLILTCLFCYMSWKKGQISESAQLKKRHQKGYYTNTHSVSGRKIERSVAVKRVMNVDFGSTKAKSSNHSGSASVNTARKNNSVSGVGSIVIAPPQKPIVNTTIVASPDSPNIFRQYAAKEPENEELNERIKDLNAHQDRMLQKKFSTKHRKHQSGKSEFEPDFLENEKAKIDAQNEDVEIDMSSMSPFLHLLQQLGDEEDKVAPARPSKAYVKKLAHSDDDEELFRPSEDYLHNSLHGKKLKKLKKEKSKLSVDLVTDSAAESSGSGDELDSVL